MRKGSVVIVACCISLFGLVGWRSSRVTMAQSPGSAACARQLAGGPGGFHVISYLFSWSVKSRNGTITLNGTGQDGSPTSWVMERLDAPQFNAIITVLHNEPGTHFSPPDCTVHVGKANDVPEKGFPRTSPSKTP